MIYSVTIRAVLRKAGVADPIHGGMILDKNYATLDRDFISGEFASGLRSFQKAMDLDQLGQDSDCDDWAFNAWSYCKFLHRLRDPNLGVAFGVYGYVNEMMNGGHVLNVAVVKEGTQYRPAFFEPQSRNLLTPKPEWLQLCDFYLF